MLILLSPAKRLDFESRLPTRKYSQPRFTEETDALIEVMRTQTVEDVAALMDLSPELATLNVERYRAFSTEHTRRNARPAVAAFAGDVYQGFDAATLTERDFTEAQKTVRILSGLYGLLRPLDLIQPYRLEMGTRLATNRGTSLYHWWGSEITDLLRADLDASPGPRVVVNLASKEYATAVHFDDLEASVITPRFENRDHRGTPRVLSYPAKRARGEMARALVTRRARSAAAVRHFDASGYQLDRERSTRQAPVFVR